MKIILAACLTLLFSSVVLCADTSISWQSCKEAVQANNFAKYCGVLTTKNAALPLITIDSQAQRSTAHRPTNDKALIYIGGGPGVGRQTANTHIQRWLRYFSVIDRDFDLVFYEQRGTAGATPFLGCTEFFVKEQARFSKNLAIEADARAYQLHFSECLDALVTKNFNLALFKAIYHQQDLDKLLEALPYSQVYLVAESWGAWLATQTQHKKIKGLILDSPLLAGMESARKPEKLHAHQRQLYRERFSDFDQVYRRAEKQLQGKVYTYQGFVLNAGRLRELAVFSLYSEIYRTEFFRALVQLKDWGKKNSASIATLDGLIAAYQESYFDPDFSIATWLLSTCDLQIPTAGESKDDYIRASRNNNPCHLLENQQASKVIAPPVLNSNTLVFAGRADPVIPFKALEKQLSSHQNVTLLDFANAGHGIILGDYCEAFVLANFIAGRALDHERHCFK